MNAPGKPDQVHETTSSVPKPDLPASVKNEISRRRALQMFGGLSAGTAFAGRALADTEGDDDEAHGPHVRVTVGGLPARVGSYVFPGEVPDLVLDNGLVRITFGRDDALGGVVTGWSNVSITATSVVVAGQELAHNLHGVEPRDPDRQHSFYIDAGGGRTRLVCSEVRILRLDKRLAEVAFVDTSSTPIRHEHHLVMRAGRRGLYGYDILTAVEATSLNEVRMNTRWDRSILDHSYNWERGAGQQPTYAYLDTQQRVQDETWRVDGVNNPNLPSPDSNSGNLAPGSVYSKYEWSLYYHENPMFGHFGQGYGVWFTALGGVTEDTLCAFYGSGPQHQDLAIHQDALILNYFNRNHYGVPAYPIPAGYRRLYGPWLTYFTVGSAADPDAMIAEAAATARAEIAEHRAGAKWVRDALYPPVSQRSTVSGRIRFTDGRPAGDLHVILSTQDSPEVFPLDEATYFVRTDAKGRFELPGIPPAWQPGTTQAGTYTLYVQPASGSVTDVFKLPGVTISGTRTHLGEIALTPNAHGTFLWQLGRSDRTAGEFALASLSPARPMPREYEKPALIPGSLTFTIGESWEPSDWYYAQTNPGTWRVRFTLDRAYAGTAYLTVAMAMQQGGRPAVAVNGSNAITGTLPGNNDSTIARQADRSGYPRTAVLSFPASLLVAGINEITFTHGSATAAGTGPGWDTIVLEVDDGTTPAAGRLAASVRRVGSGFSGVTWRVTVRNHGSRTAYDVRLTGLRTEAARAPRVSGKDPNAFPVPVTAWLAPGATASVDVTVAGDSPVTVAVSADGGRTTATAG